MIAHAALMHWCMESVDVKTAFLYGELDEELYMRQPEGFVDPKRPHAVFHPKQAIYGLEQAALQWWHVLDKSMMSIGFK